MNRSTNFNLYLPENSDYRDVSQFSWNFEQIDTELGRTKDMAVNTSTFSAVSALVTYISGFSNGTRMMVSISNEITADFIGSSAGTNATAIIYKASNNNAYYWIFARDEMACGNIDLSGGTVSIKQSTNNISITNQSSMVADVSVQTNTDTEIKEISLVKGEYIIILTAIWASNATGRRNIWASETAAGSRINYGSDVTMMAVNGAGTRQQLTFVFRATSDTSIHFCAYQNSGSTITLTPRYSVVRIK